MLKLQINSFQFKLIQINSTQILFMQPTPNEPNLNSQLAPATPEDSLLGMKKAIKKQKIISIILGSFLLICIIAGLVTNIYWYDKKTKLDRALMISENSVTFQKKQKDEIRNLWEDQAALSDNLVFSQTQLFNRLEIYQKIILQSIGFESGKTIIKEDINTSKLKKTEDDLYTILQDINGIINNNATKKDEAKKKIDVLYIEADEDQKNRINYIDGIRD